MTSKFFYQSIDLPGEPTHVGQWDHRATTDAFLGGTDFTNKTVLEIGPANGFWTFEIERRGGSVTCVELGDDDAWDIVPHHGRNARDGVDGMRQAVAGIQAAFWHGHEKTKSQARVKRGSIYDVPQLVEPAQIGLVGNVLAHLRDPFLGLERLAGMVTERMIVSETTIEDPDFLASHRLQFLPRADDPLINHSWYLVSPTLVVEWLKMLGFKSATFELHRQQFVGSAYDGKPRMVQCYTCVADRD